MKNKFVSIPQAALALGGSALRACILLRGHLPSAGGSYPAADLAADIGVSIPTARRAIRALTEHGIMERLGRRLVPVVSDSRFGLVPISLATAPLSGAAIKTYLALSLHADRWRICWPGDLRIGWLSGLSVRRVREALDELRRKGWIEDADHPRAPRGARTIRLIDPEGDHESDHQSDHFAHAENARKARPEKASRQFPEQGTYRTYKHMNKNNNNDLSDSLIAGDGSRCCDEDQNQIPPSLGVWADSLKGILARAPREYRISIAWTVAHFWANGKVKRKTPLPLAATLVNMTRTGRFVPDDSLINEARNQAALNEESQDGRKPDPSSLPRDDGASLSPQVMEKIKRAMAVKQTGVVVVPGMGVVDVRELKARGLWTNKDDEEVVHMTLEAHPKLVRDLRDGRPVRILGMWMQVESLPMRLDPSQPPPGVLHQPRTLRMGVEHSRAP